MHLDDVRATLERLGLGAIADQVLARHRPCVWLCLSEPGAGPAGSSRIGGSPDAPAGAVWPLMPDGQPIVFVMQLALPALPVPVAGLLSLFVGEMDGGYDVPHRLWLTPPGTPLHPLTPPPSSGDGMFDHIEPHSLLLVPGPDFPRWATRDCSALTEGLSEEDQDSYHDDFRWALEPAPAKQIVGKLLGHVAGIGDDPREDAVVWAHDPARMYDRAFSSEVHKSDREGVQMRQWTNLLMVDSSQALDVCIGDAGYLQFMIKDDRLAAGALERTYGQLESS